MSSRRPHRNTTPPAPAVNTTAPGAPLVDMEPPSIVGVTASHWFDFLEKYIPHRTSVTANAGDSVWAKAAIDLTSRFVDPIHKITVIREINARLKAAHTGAAPYVPITDETLTTDMIFEHAQIRSTEAPAAASLDHFLEDLEDSVVEYNGGDPMDGIHHCFSTIEYKLKKKPSTITITPRQISKCFLKCVRPMGLTKHYLIDLKTNHAEDVDDTLDDRELLLSGISKFVEDNLHKLLQTIKDLRDLPPYKDGSLTDTQYELLGTELAKLLKPSKKQKPAPDSKKRSSDEGYEPPYKKQFVRDNSRADRGHRGDGRGGRGSGRGGRGGRGGGGGLGFHERDRHNNGDRKPTDEATKKAQWEQRNKKRLEKIGGKCFNCDASDHGSWERDKCTLACKFASLGCKESHDSWKCSFKPTAGTSGKGAPPRKIKRIHLQGKGNTFTGWINRCNKPVEVVTDYGADECCITETLARELEAYGVIEIDPMDEPVVAELADGHTIECTYDVFVKTLTMDVGDINEIDKSYLTTHNIRFIILPHVDPDARFLLVDESVIRETWDVDIQRLLKAISHKAHDHGDKSPVSRVIDVKTVRTGEPAVDNLLQNDESDIADYHILNLGMEAMSLSPEASVVVDKDGVTWGQHENWGDM